MKNILNIFLLALFCFSSAAWTANKNDTTDKKLANTCGERIDVKVNGLVCDFCAQAVEKVFRKKEEVTDIDVNLSSGVIGIQFKEHQTLSDDVLSKMILDSGYNVVEINRDC